MESWKAHGGSSQVRMLPAIELWSRLKAGPLSGEKQPWMRAEGGKCFCKASILVCLSPAICEAFLGSSMARATHCFDSHIISSGMWMWERSSGSNFCSILRSWHKAFTRWVKIGRALMQFFYLAVLGTAMGVRSLCNSPWSLFSEPLNNDSRSYRMEARRFEL